MHLEICVIVHTQIFNKDTLFVPEMELMSINDSFFQKACKVRQPSVLRDSLEQPLHAQLMEQWQFCTTNWDVRRNYEPLMRHSATVMAYLVDCIDGRLVCQLESICGYRPLLQWLRAPGLSRQQHTGHGLHDFGTPRMPPHCKLSASLLARGVISSEQSRILAIMPIDTACWPRLRDIWTPCELQDLAQER